MNSPDSSADDMLSLARLHEQCLDDSIFSLMGTGALATYYRFVTRSDRESLFLIRDEGTIIGAAVLSTSPHDMSGRLFRRYGLALSGPLIKGLVGSATFRTRFFKHLIAKDSTPAALALLPEIVQIFVHPDHRNQQIGSRLLNDAEGWLRVGGVNRYYIKTHNVGEQNQALPFYESRGFSRAGESTFAGELYVYFVKEIS